MRHHTLTLALATLLQVQPLIFEVDLWPEEGRPVFEAAGQPLQLRATPSLSAPIVATQSIQAGRRVMFDQTLYRTTRAGAFNVLKTSEIIGRDLGNVTRLNKADYYSAKFPQLSVSVNPGETIEYLQYRAEGTCFIRIRSRVVDAELCPNQQPDRFRTLREPTTEWWIHLTVSKSVVGWVPVSDGTVKEIDRQGESQPNPQMEPARAGQ